MIIFILSERSRSLAERLQSSLKEAEIVCSSEACALLQTLFVQGYTLIGICSTGILIRSLGPILGNKRTEPPVIAVAPDGRCVIPLLGGHRGGNRLAARLARILGIEPSVTTASDAHFDVALDEPPCGWHVATPERLKACLKDLLQGAAVRLEGRASWLEEKNLPWSENGNWTLKATVYRAPEPPERMIVYHPALLALGIGCEKGTSEQELETLVFETLERYGLASEAIGIIVSIENKIAEPALTRLSQILNCERRFFSASELERETPRLQTPSKQVYELMRCHGVAEAAALAAVGPRGHLLIAKQKSVKATCAIAQGEEPIDPNSIGRKSGALAIVGIGPGGLEWCLPQALIALRACHHLVGYGGYLDLVKGFSLRGKRHRFDLGQEFERARYALDLAASGTYVGLISSGDPGIYAMATIVFEILDAEPTLERESVEILVYPGLTAMHVLAAAAGAPLGHDFCVISLSDVLTPWSVIEKRLIIAAQSDLGVVLYNPVSQRRSWQLRKTREIFTLYRSSRAPVIIGRNLTRPGQNITFLTLEELEPAGLDMLSILIIGSPRTKTFLTRTGRAWCYTPRS